MLLVMQVTKLPVRHSLLFSHSFAVLLMKSLVLRKLYYELDAEFFSYTVTRTLLFTSKLK